MPDPISRHLVVSLPGEASDGRVRYGSKVAVSGRPAWLSPSIALNRWGNSVRVHELARSEHFNRITQTSGRHLLAKESVLPDLSLTAARPDHLVCLRQTYLRSDAHS